MMPSKWPAYTMLSVQRFLSVVGAVPKHSGQYQISDIWRRCHSLTALPLERLQQAVTPEVCQELSIRGYAVVDGVFGDSNVKQLRHELLSVYDRGLMHLNHTQLVNKGATTLLPKSQIHEAELTLDPSIQQAAPMITQLNADKTLATMLSLHIPQLRLESQAIKMQHNEGSGGCFPMHFDSDASLDGRRVTAIIYLNEHWQPGSGGELRLYPFPAPPVDIAPIADRMCLFASTSMLHRVLPSHQPRSCFTIWLSEGERRAHSAALAGAAGVTAPPGLDSADADAVWRFLMQPAVRQHVCKLAYADEWEQSIVESHPQSSDTQAALATHQQEVQRVRTALQKYSEPLQQLLEAVKTLSASNSGRTTAVQEPTEQDLQQAVGLLRAAAAHVKWF